MKAKEKAFIMHSDVIKKNYGIAENHLKIVDIKTASVTDRTFAISKFKAKECFNNSLIMSLINGDDLIIGFYFWPEFGLAIEHAWNANELNHYDLTAELFWQHKSEQALYIELFRFSKDEAIKIHHDHGLIDFTTLRRSKVFRDLISK